LRHDLLGDEREHLVVVALTVSKSVTMLSLDFSSAEQKMEDVDTQMVMQVMTCQVQKW